MKIAIISDIHSNLEAMEAVAEELVNLSVDEVYFAGDAVGYGADPDPCTHWVAENADLAVAGNHDFAAVGIIESDSFNLYAREAIRWNAEHLGEEEARYLSDLPLTETRNGITIVHANPSLPEEWGYIFTLWDAEMNFPYFEGEFCFVGHSHQPVVVRMDSDGAVSIVPGDSLHLEEDSRYLINVGSVGQPRDGNPAACFGLIDMEKSEFSLIRVTYDVGKTHEKMSELGLPQPLADRLLEGK